MHSNAEHLRRAALALVGAGPIKQRLIDAYREHLLAIDATALPESVAPEFAELMSAFQSASAAGGLGVAEVAVRKMSEVDAARHARSVLEISFVAAEVESAFAEAATAPRLRVVGDAEEIPAFLSRA